MELKIKKIIDFGRKVEQNYHPIDRALDTFDDKSSRLFYPQFVKRGKYFYQSNQDEVKKMKIDFSKIYSKKYAVLFRPDNIRKLNKFYDNLLQKASLYDWDEDKPNGLYLAIYLMMLWYTSIILLAKPVVSLKQRDLWEDFMTSETLNLQKSVLDNFRLLGDLMDKSVDTIVDADIDDRDIKVIGNGVKRVLKSVNQVYETEM